MTGGGGGGWAVVRSQIVNGISVMIRTARSALIIVE